MNTRRKHIDIAKGIGILLVVFGHNSIVVDEKRELFNVIYSFHIPLFLFLSGLFFNADGKLTRLMLNKIDSLIKPYLITLLMVYILFKDKNGLLIDYFAGVIYGNGATIPGMWVALWFLTHLWAVSVFSWLFVKLTKLSSLKILLQLLILFCILVIGFFICRVFWQIPINILGIKLEINNQPFLLPGLPFSIDIILVSGFFFLLGFLLKNRVIDFEIHSKYLLLNFLIFCSCHYFFDYTMSLNDRRYDNLIISTLEAISGIYIILTISIFISKNKVISQIFSYIGSASLFILIFHKFFQNRTFSFFANHYEINLFTEFLAFIVGSTIPLLIWELVKRNDYLALLFLPIKYNKSFQDKN